jgi:hypothetical protein
MAPTRASVHDGRMRKVAVAILSCAAIAALTTSSAPAAVNHCKLPKKAKVLGRTTLVYAYSVKNSEGDSNLYGCLRTTGKRSKIFEGFDDTIESYSKITKVVLNGRFIAMQIEDYDISCKAACPDGYNPYTYTLARYDVKRRKPYSVTGQAQQDSLIVSARLGKLAWIQSSGVGFEVHVNKQTIDQGAVDPRSLKLVGDKLTWTNAGTVMTYTLK